MFLLIGLLIGLHTTFVVAGVIMAASVIVGAWGMSRERRDRLQPAVAAADA